MQACVRKMPRGVVTHLFHTMSQRPMESVGRMPAHQREMNSAACSPRRLAKLDVPNSRNAPRTASNYHFSWRWYALPNPRPKSPSYRPTASHGGMPAPNRDMSTAACSPRRLAKLGVPNSRNAPRTASNYHFSWRWSVNRRDWARVWGFGRGDSLIGHVRS